MHRLGMSAIGGGSKQLHSSRVFLDATPTLVVHATQLVHGPLRAFVSRKCEPLSSLDEVPLASVRVVPRTNTGKVSGARMNRRRELAHLQLGRIARRNRIHPLELKPLSGALHPLASHRFVVRDTVSLEIPPGQLLDRVNLTQRRCPLIESHRLTVIYVYALALAIRPGQGAHRLLVTRIRSLAPKGGAL